MSKLVRISSELDCNNSKIVEHKDVYGNIISKSIEASIKIDFISDGDMSFLLNKKGELSKKKLFKHILENHIK